MSEDIEFRNITPSEIGEEYWRLMAEKRTLPLMRCESCGKHRQYLTRVCWACHSTDYRWVEAKGTGRLYAFTEIFYPPSAEFVAPYINALVDLDEGVRIMSNVLNAKAADLKIGTPVRVVFETLPDGKLLPQVTPSAA
jgi:uncharacterized OB-fold protein